jgi:chromosome partitioning protein
MSGRSASASAGTFAAYNGVRVLAVTNQKGGVGKTTTAINLGTAMAAIGERVLIIDIDSQGNASTGVGIEVEARRITTWDVLAGTATLTEAAMPTAVPNLSIVTANHDLVGFDTGDAPDTTRPFRLRNAIAAAAGPHGAPYSYILIDCPPALNLLTLNALTAADALLVPVQCEFFALEGIAQLNSTVDQVRATLNPGLTIQGVVLTMHDQRLGLTREVAAEVRTAFGAKVYETVIPRNIRIAEAPSHGQPILIYDYDCSGSQAYIKLATEIINREAQLKAA